MAKSKNTFKHQVKTNRVLVAIAFDVFFLAVVAFVFNLNLNIFAASHNITGGSYGPLCNSGGYFTPNTMTIASGDTVTISVPANDPYSGGLEVHGFPEGAFTIQNGTSHTTQPLTANVSYYGSWPYTGCTKGSGTITVSHPAPPPPPPSRPSPSPTPTPPPAPTPGVHPSPTPGPSPATHKASPSPSPTSKSVVRPSASPSPTPSPSPGENTDNAQQPVSATSTQFVNAKNTSSGLTPQRKVVGFTSLFLAIVVTGWIVWQLFVRPNKI